MTKHFLLFDGMDPPEERLAAESAVFEVGRAPKQELAGSSDELAHRASESRLTDSENRHLIDRSDLLALVLDRDLNVTSVTPAARELFASSDEELGESIARFAEYLNLPSLKAEAEAALQSGVSRELEAVPSGASWFKLRLLAFRADPHGPGLFITLTELTEQAFLAELARRAVESIDIQAFFQEGTELVRRAMRAETVEVLAVNGHPAELEVVSLSPPESHARRSRKLLVTSALRAALGRHEVLMVRPRDWGGHSELPFGALASIRTRENTFGLLAVHFREERALPREKLAFLRALADVFASAYRRKLLEDGRLAESEASTRRRSEERLSRAERLASLGTFAAGIAHELNNPLSNIGLCAEYAAKTQDSDRRAKLLSNIEVNAQRCGRIVESVLRFAKDEATRRWPVDLYAVIHHSVDLVKSYVGLDRLKADLKLTETNPKLVCNPTEMEQVFVNLLRNAVEAHPGQCQVCIRSVVEKDRILIRVSDNGPGVALADRERIFDPFFSTRRSSGGTGLGLSITHRIVTGHGGNLRLLNGLDAGATFEIELPRDASENERVGDGTDPVGR